MWLHTVLVFWFSRTEQAACRQTAVVRRIDITKSCHVLVGQHAWRAWQHQRYVMSLKQADSSSITVGT